MNCTNCGEVVTLQTIKNPACDGDYWICTGCRIIFNPEYFPENQPSRPDDLPSTTTSEWIRVEDKKPVHGQYCTLRINDAIPEFELYAYDEPGDLFWGITCTMTTLQMHISHWMAVTVRIPSINEKLP